MIYMYKKITEQTEKTENGTGQSIPSFRLFCNLLHLFLEYMQFYRLERREDNTALNYNHAIMILFNSTQTPPLVQEDDDAVLIIGSRAIGRPRS